MTYFNSEGESLFRKRKDGYLVTKTGQNKENILKASLNFYFCMFLP